MKRFIQFLENYDVYLDMPMGFNKTEAKDEEETTEEEEETEEG
jgi:hypothetical protein